MPSELLGRTNRAFPPVWLALSMPSERVPDNDSAFDDDARAGAGDIEELVAAAADAGAPIDISSQPGLWGGYLRHREFFSTYVGSTAYETAPSDRHAQDLVQADLFQVLSAIGREELGIYFLNLRRACEEYQIAGVLEALELARQEGHIRYIGLSCSGPAFATLGMWQFHDAFEVLLVPRNPYDEVAYQTLAPLAAARRVGVVTSRPLEWSDGVSLTEFPGCWRLRNLCKSFYSQTVGQAVIGELCRDHPVLTPVHSAQEVREAIEAPAKSRPAGLREFLQPFVEAYDDPAEWTQMASSSTPRVRQAAQRWCASHGMALT